MSEITRDHTYIDGKPAQPSHANENEDKLFALVNGNLDWDNLNKAVLQNKAGGIPKLDGDTLVELVQIPATLTGKDADTLDTKEYQDIADEIDADIVAHKDNASAHHAKTVSSDIDHGSVLGLGDDDHPQYLKKAGGTMTGFLTLHAAPTSNLHASTKKYVDDAIAAGGFGDMLKSVYDANLNNIVDNSEKLEGSTKTQVRDHTPKSHALSAHTKAVDNIDMNFKRIRNLPTPGGSYDPTHKDYVDHKTRAGGNGNGFWVTCGEILICQVVKELTFTDEGEKTVTWTFPGAFKAGTKPAVLVTVNSSTAEWTFFHGVANEPTNTSVTVGLCDLDNLHTGTWKIGCLAIGVW